MFEDKIESWFTLRYPSNSSMDVYHDNKIPSFRVNCPDTLHVDPEHWEVALK